MPNIRIRKATQADADAIAESLREADYVELQAAVGGHPETVARACLEHCTWARCVDVDGRPAVIYGVSPLEGARHGSPWMLGTSEISLIGRAFVQGSRRELVKMARDYDWLWNQVHKDNEVSIRWLRWLGFHVDTTEPVGPGGQFFDFWKGVPNV